MPSRSSLCAGSRRRANTSSCGRLLDASCSPKAKSPSSRALPPPTRRRSRWTGASASSGRSSGPDLSSSDWSCARIVRSSSWSAGAGSIRARQRAFAASLGRHRGPQPGARHDRARASRGPLVLRAAGTRRRAPGARRRARHAVRRPDRLRCAARVSRAEAPRAEPPGPAQTARTQDPPKGVRARARAPPAGSRRPHGDGRPPKPSRPRRPSLRSAPGRATSG